jgi:hypothetical protein
MTIIGGVLLFFGWVGGVGLLRRSVNFVYIFLGLWLAFVRLLWV